jgi:glycine cleavage system H protein
MTIKYSDEHSWVMLNEESSATIGITDFAQEQLGDLMTIELPELGTQITRGNAVCNIESVKTASELIAPVSGTIIEVNNALDDEPENVNDDPMGDGWFIKVEMSDETELDELMDQDSYDNIA